MDSIAYQTWTGAVFLLELCHDEVGAVVVLSIFCIVIDKKLDAEGMENPCVV